MTLVHITCSYPTVMMSGGPTLNTVQRMGVKSAEPAVNLTKLGQNSTVSEKLARTKSLIITFS